MAAPRVFVSHSHQDLDYCRAYVQALRTHGLDVWYDEHNLGWGALRQTIEREMEAREHFVAILSPASVGSEWVNTEIDGALEMLREGRLRTLLFVLAAPCAVPLLLRRYKRVEGPGGAPVGIVEAVARTVRVVTGQESAQPAVEAPAAAAAPVPQPVTPEAVPVAPAATPAAGSASLPPRLAQLGFAARNVGGVALIVPPVCDVPAGEFLMGADPAPRISLPAYQIGRYPVTVAEYACFVRDGRHEPAAWQDQMRKLDHPVMRVSWQDARAYAAWLARRTGEPWRLPTEAEWEKAARWDSGTQYARTYPWGDAFDQARCNAVRGAFQGFAALFSIGTGTTPVGSFAERGDASPCDAHDMAGNVFEWTSSLNKDYPYRADDGRERSDSGESRIIRGGSWSFGSTEARTTYRYGITSTTTRDDIGFRLVRTSAAQ